MKNERILIQKQSDLSESIRVLSGEKQRLEAQIQDIDERKKQADEYVNSSLNKASDIIAKAKKLANIAKDKNFDADKRQRNLDRLESVLLTRKNTLELDAKSLEDRELAFTSYMEERQKSLETEEQDIRSSLEDLKKTKELMIDEIDVLMSEIDSYGLKLAQSETKFNELEYSHEENKLLMSRQIEALQKELDDLQSELLDKSKINDSVRSELDQRQRRLDRQTADLMIMRRRFKEQLQHYFPHLPTTHLEDNYGL